MTNNFSFFPLQHEWVYHFAYQLQLPDVWWCLWQRAETGWCRAHQWASYNFDPFTAWRIRSCCLDYCLPFEVIRSLGLWCGVYSTAPLSQGPMTHWTSPSRILCLHTVQSRSLLESGPQWEAVGGADVCLSAWFRVKWYIYISDSFRLCYISVGGSRSVSLS